MTRLRGPELVLDVDGVRLVLESIRSEPTETDGLRLTFALPFGWDSGVSDLSWQAVDL